MTIVGNYVQAGSGSLNIALASPTSFDQLAVGGSATLNGILNVTQLNGFSPVEGNAFPILTFASRSGDFSTKTGLGLPNSLALNPVYNATNLTLQTSITTAANISLVSTANPSTYGQSLTFTVNVAPITSGLPAPTGTVQFQLDGTNWGQVATLVNGAATSPAIANLAAGSHTITVLYSGDTTYSSSSDTLQQTVNKATLTVTADPKTKLYGDAVPALTYTISGYVLGENAGSAGVTGSPNLSTAATASSPVAGSPYAINVDPGTLATSNYTFAAQAGTLTVNQAHLTVTADNQSKIQGNPNPTLTYTITGFVNGDTSSVVSGAPVLSTTATTGSLAGNYPITVSVGTLSAANYDFPNLVSGTLTVVAQTGVSVTVSPNSSPSTYGQAVTFSVSVSPTSADPTPTGTVQFQADGVNFGSAITLVNGAATSAPISSLTAGSHTIAAIYSGDSTYPSSSGTTSQTVNQTHLTVTADNQSKIQGNPNPTLTFTITGFVNSETSSVVSGAPVLSTTATTSSPVGSYPITIAAGTLGAANYDFPAANLIPGTLTVVAPSGVLVSVNPSANASTYGQPVSFAVTVSPATSGVTPTGTVQFQADGVNFGSAVTLVNGAATSMAISNLGDGSHTITAQYSGDSTYATETGSVNQIVGKAHLTVTPDNQSRTYGQDNPNLTYTISGFVNGDTSAVVSGTPVLSTAASAASPVGAYAITVSVTGLSAANYDFTGQAATLTVSPAHLTVTADNQTKFQSNPNPTLTYTIAGFVNGDTAAVVSGAPVLSTTATTSSPPGSYPITVGVGTLAAANYDFPTLVNGTLTITIATQIAPDLAVFASDITFSPAHPDPGQPVTLSAVIHNLGPADASNITVAALDFTNSLGSLTIPSLGAGASTQVSFNLTGFPESNRLITVQVDPGHQIQDLNENNNEASVVLQVGNPQFSVSGATIVVQANSASASVGSITSIQGQANYQFTALPGTSYPVQGGKVTITITDPVTSQVIATYTGTHTLTGGSFSQPILAPAQAGTYIVTTQVTDSTVTATAISNLVVTVQPNAPPPLPAVPPSQGTIPSGGGSPWIGGTITVGSNPAPAPGDVYVFSEDIVFSNQPQNVGDTIFIAAFIRYDGTVPVYDIPVDVNDIFPVNGALHSFPIGETTVDFPSPSTNNYAVVVMPWTNTARGAHIIQVAVDPPFPQFTGNDKATR